MAYFFGPPCICNFDFISLLLPSFLRYVVYVLENKWDYFFTTCFKTPQVVTLNTCKVVYYISKLFTASFTSTCDFDKSTSKQVITIWSKQYPDLTLTWRENNAICRLQSTHSKTYEPLALHQLEQTIIWVYNFALRALEDANRLITDSQSRLRTRLLSIVMRDKALRRSSEFRYLPTTTQKKTSHRCS